MTTTDHPKRTEWPKIIDAIRHARSDPSITLDQAARLAGTTEAPSEP